jgi:putative acetyltransferase
MLNSADSGLLYVEPIFRCISGEDEKAQVIELLRKAFKKEIFGINLTEAVWHPDYFAAEHTRVAAVESSIVSVVVFGIREMRFPPCLVKAATIGPVATMPDYEGMGMASRLLHHTLAYIESLGINIAYLQGTPDYYSKFDFYPYLAKSKVRVESNRMYFETSATLIEYQPHHLNRLKDIFSRSTNARVCAAYRDDSIWNWLTVPGRATFYFYKPMIITSAAGDIFGYLTTDPDDPLNIRELVIEHTPYACEAALSALKQMAMNFGVSEFEIKLPWDDYLMMHLRISHKGLFLQHCHSDGGAMMKLINPLRVFQELQPYFAARLKGITVPDTEFTICLESQLISFFVVANCLVINGNSSDNVLYCDESMLPGLVSGYYSYEQLRPFLREEKLINNVTVNLLFPVNFPFVYQGDNY